MTNRRYSIFGVIALIVGPLVLTLLHNSRSEDRAIATIIRSGGRVYYDFQSPTLTTRNSQKAKRTVASLTSDSWPVPTTSFVASPQPGTQYSSVGFTETSINVTPYPDSPFALNARGTIPKIQLDAEENSDVHTLATERKEMYFEVPPFSASDDMAERILIDLRRRIECATVGPRLDSDVIDALTQLRQLRQLIVHGSNREKRQELAQKLPAVDIIYR